MGTLAQPEEKTRARSWRALLRRPVAERTESVRSVAARSAVEALASLAVHRPETQTPPPSQDQRKGKS